MNKIAKIICTIVAIVIIAVIVVAIMTNLKSKTNLQITSAEDLAKLIDQIYEGQQDNLPNSLQTQIVDMTDDAAIQSFTGLENGKDLEYLVVSEPMMTSQAYSFVLAKVKTGVNADTIAQTMKEKVDTRKWICVSAEMLYCTTSGDIVCLVMSTEENAKPVYEKFKTIAKTIGKEYQKVEEEPNLPPDMY